MWVNIGFYRELQSFWDMVGGGPALMVRVRNRLELDTVEGNTSVDETRLVRYMTPLSPHFPHKLSP